MVIEVFKTTGIKPFSVINLKRPVAGGFQWRKVSENICDDIKPYYHKNVIYQFDLNKNLIATYNSILETIQKTGIKRKLIIDCCKGKILMIDTFIFKYAYKC